jgi:hypothetical protein
MTTTKPKLVYKIFEILDGGTLAHPTEDYYGRPSPIYNEYGYESVEEAIADIEKKASSSNLVILPTIYWEWEE